MKSLLFLLKQKLQSNFFFSPLIVFSIEEQSMLPLLSPGEKVLVSRMHKGKIGDIIVFINPDVKSKQLYLIKQVVNIENNKVYVVGKNTLESFDSRKFGWISKKNIIGKMLIKL